MRDPPADQGLIARSAAALPKVSVPDSLRQLQSTACDGPVVVLSLLSATAGLALTQAPNSTWTQDYFLAVCSSQLMMKRMEVPRLPLHYLQVGCKTSACLQVQTVLG